MSQAYSLPEPRYRAWTIALAGLLLLQIAGALVWQKWFRHESGAASGVVPRMQQYTRERRYDEAIKTGLGALKQTAEDDTVLQQVALVFLRRGQIESTDKEHDAAQAVDYAEKALAVNPSNQADFYGTARVLEIAGDFSAGKRCEYYRRSIELFQNRLPLLGGAAVTVQGKSMPTGPLKQENDYLLQRVKSKMAKAGCA